MRRLKRVSCLLGLLVFCGVYEAKAKGFEIDASAGFLSHSFKGEFEYEGTRISLKDDLGIKGRGQPLARIRFEHSVPLLPNIYLQYMPTQLKGDKVLTRDIDFGDETFTVNSRVKSEIKLDKLDVTLYSGLGFIRKATKNVLKPELGVNFRLFQSSAKLTTDDGRQSESKKVTLPLPLPYVAGELNPPSLPLGLRAELRGLPLGKVQYYDLSCEARLYPIKNAYIGVGYRMENFKIKDVQDVFADFKDRGFYGVLGFKF